MKRLIWFVILSQRRLFKEAQQCLFFCDLHIQTSKFQTVLFVLFVLGWCYNLFFCYLLNASNEESTL